MISIGRDFVFSNWSRVVVVVSWLFFWTQSLHLARHMLRKVFTKPCNSIPRSRGAIILLSSHLISHHLTLSSHSHLTLISSINVVVNVTELSSHIMLGIIDSTQKTCHVQASQCEQGRGQ